VTASKTVQYQDQTYWQLERILYPAFRRRGPGSQRRGLPAADKPWLQVCWLRESVAAQVPAARPRHGGSAISAFPENSQVGLSTVTTAPT